MSRGAGSWGGGTWKPAAGLQRPVVAGPRGPQLSPWRRLAQDWTGFHAPRTLGAFQTLTPETGPRCGLSQCPLLFGPVGPCSSWGTRLRHVPEDRGSQSRGSGSCRVGEQVGFQPSSRDGWTGRWWAGRRRAGHGGTVTGLTASEAPGRQDQKLQVHPAGGHLLNDRPRRSGCTLWGEGDEPMACILIGRRGVCLCCALLGCAAWPLLCFRSGPPWAAASHPGPPPPGSIICRHLPAPGIATGSSRRFPNRCRLTRKRYF